MDIEAKFPTGARVNEYWCGNGTVTGTHGNYVEVKWDSGLSNPAIKGYHHSILSLIK